MAEKIRIGFIGCGGIMYNHLKRMLEYPEAEVAALTDPVAANIQRHQTTFPALQGVKTFADHRQMLEDGSLKLNAVVIATPHTLHYDQIMDSLDGDLHVLTEKPLVCSVEEAKSVIAKQEVTERVVLVSYQRHYQPPFIYMREQIAKGLIGRVTAVSAFQGQDWLRGTRGAWRQDPALAGGGQLNDSGSHLLDILLWCTGLAVDEVMASIDNRGAQVDINSAITIRFKSGAIGSLAVIGDCPVWWEDFTVIGENGAFFYRNGQLTVSVRGEEPFQPKDLPQGSDPDRNFLDVILGHDKNRSPAVCGLRGIELCEAAWRSAEEKRPVKVSELD